MSLFHAWFRRSPQIVRCRACNCDTPAARCVRGVCDVCRRPANAVALEVRFPGEFPAQEETYLRAIFDDAAGEW